MPSPFSSFSCRLRLSMFPASQDGAFRRARVPQNNISDEGGIENITDIEKRISKALEVLACADPVTHIVGWDGPDDPKNPMNFSRSKKWTITMVTAFITLTVSFASSVFSTATIVTAKEFKVSLEVMILGVSLYVLGFACGESQHGENIEHV
jgi:DHA1 family multidrug resistance protein-like MFS transporter